MFEDENLDDMDIVLDVVPSPLMGRSPPASPFHCFPSPTAAPSPGVSSPPASPFQKEDFGECVSQPSVEVFGAVPNLEWFASIIDKCHFLEFLNNGNMEI